MRKHLAFLLSMALPVLFASLPGPVALSAEALTKMLPQLEKGAALFLLGSESGAKGTHLIVKLEGNGRALLVDPATRVAGLAEIRLESWDPAARKGTLVLTEHLPAPGIPVSFEATGVGQAAKGFRLIAQTGNAAGEALHLIPGSTSLKLGSYRIPAPTDRGYLEGVLPTIADTVQKPPYTISDLQSRFSVNDDFLNCAWTILKANARPEGKAVFLLGNSTMREGIDPDQLSGLVGTPVYKLAFSGSTPVESLMTLRRIDTRPGDTVILHFHPGELTKWMNPDPEICLPSAESDFRTWINESRSPFQLFSDNRSIRDLAPLLQEPHDKERVNNTLKDILGFYRMRGIYNHGMKGSFSPEDWVHYRYSSRNNRQINAVKQQSRAYPAVARVDNALLDESNAAVKAFRAMASDAAKRGVRLLIVEAPINSSAWGESWDPPTKTALDGLAGTLPIHFVPKGLMNTGTHYIDHNHLNAEGRRVHTSYVASLLSR